MKYAVYKIALLVPAMALVSIPVATYAGAPDLTYFQSLIGSVQELIEMVIPLVIALGLLFFIWGLVQFILASGNEEAKDEGKRRMVWGIIALFVIVSVWGLVGLLNQLTGIEQGVDVILPRLPF
jgi:hypothetical protein